jgi:hypothetical protein
MIGLQKCEEKRQRVVKSWRKEARVRVKVRVKVKIK